MSHSQFHLLFTPSKRTQETVEANLADGLKAKPFSTDVTGVFVFQGVHVDTAFRLRLARLKGLVDDVKLLLLDKTLPVLLYLLADSIAVHSHLVRPQLLLALMFILVGQAAGDVADLLGPQPVDEPDVQQDAGAGPAAGIAVGLLQPVVLPVLTCLRVVSHLRREIHAAKVSIIFLTAVFYNGVLAS